MVITSTEKTKQDREKGCLGKGVSILSRIGMDTSPIGHLCTDLKKVKKHGRWTPKKRVQQTEGGRVLG